MLYLRLNESKQVRKISSRTNVIAHPVVLELLLKSSFVDDYSPPRTSLASIVPNCKDFFDFQCCDFQCCNFRLRNCSNLTKVTIPQNFTYLPFTTQNFTNVSIVPTALQFCASLTEAVSAKIVRVVTSLIPGNSCAKTSVRLSNSCTEAFGYRDTNPCGCFPPELS